MSTKEKYTKNIETLARMSIWTHCGPKVALKQAETGVSKSTKRTKRGEQVMIHTKHKLAGLAAAAVVMTCFLGTLGCGQSGVSGTLATGSGSSLSSLTTTTTTSPSASPTVSTTPDYTYSFTMSGEGGTDPTYTTPGITTDTTLQVTITAAAAGELSLPNGAYSGFTASYGCVTYEVTVLGETVTTAILSPNPGSDSLCPSAPSSQMIDFSDRLTPGHGAVTIEVSQAAYDFYCIEWYEGYYSGDYSLYNTETYSAYCPMHPVYKTHTVGGTLGITVDGS